MDPFFDLLNKSVIILSGFQCIFAVCFNQCFGYFVFFKQLKSSSQFLKLQFISSYEYSFIGLLTLNRQIWSVFAPFKNLAGGFKPIKDFE